MSLEKMFPDWETFEILFSFTEPTWLPLENTSSTSGLIWFTFSPQSLIRTSSAKVDFTLTVRVLICTPIFSCRGIHLNLITSYGWLKVEIALYWILWWNILLGNHYWPPLYFGTCGTLGVGNHILINNVTFDHPSLLPSLKVAPQLILTAWHLCLPSKY